jgi:hypothetical protein
MLTTKKQPRDRGVVFWLVIKIRKRLMRLVDQRVNLPHGRLTDQTSANG